MAQVNKVRSVRTLALIARDLGTDEDWLAELANSMDREDGLIWVYGIDDENGTIPFTDIGVENLATLIADLGSSRPYQPDSCRSPAAFAGWIRRACRGRLSLTDEARRPA